MNKLINLVKKIGLFLFGIFLVVWGYKSNAAYAAEKKEATNKTEDASPVQSVDAQTEATNVDETPTQVKPEEKKDTTSSKTTIETGQQAEESSGTT